VVSAFVGDGGKGVVHEYTSPGSRYQPASQYGDYYCCCLGQPALLPYIPNVAGEVVGAVVGAARKWKGETWCMSEIVYHLAAITNQLVWRLLLLLLSKPASTPTYLTHL